MDGSKVKLLLFGLFPKMDILFLMNGLFRLIHYHHPTVFLKDGLLKNKVKRKRKMKTLKVKTLCLNSWGISFLVKTLLKPLIMLMLMKNLLQLRPPVNLMMMNLFSKDKRPQSDSFQLRCLALISLAFNFYNYYKFNHFNFIILNL